MKENSRARGTALLCVLASCALIGAFGTRPLHAQAAGADSEGASTLSDALAGATRALGERLFFDQRLSADGTVSCATCHRPELAFTHGEPVATGAGGRRGTRNAPSLIGAGAQRSFFWDGRRQTLEAQVIEPFVNPAEHGLKDQAELLARIRADGAYAAEFQKIFGAGGQSVSVANLAHALAQYVRTLAPSASPFDRFQRGAPSALSNGAQRGLALFRGQAGCASCHRLDDTPALLADHDFHGAGVGLEVYRARLPEIIKRIGAMSPTQLGELVTRDPAIAELGRFVATRNAADIGKFKTPSLRNVALTAPYMHNGSVPTLEAAVDHELYYRSLVEGRALFLSPEEKSDLIEFLGTLTEDRFRKP
jgi:cytochrome c peroxidase